MELGENSHGGCVDDFAGGGVDGSVQCCWARLSTADWLPPPIAPPFPVDAVTFGKFGVVDAGVGEVGRVCIVDGDALSGRVDWSGSRHVHAHTQAEGQKSS